MPPPISSSVGAAKQAADHRELVRGLRAAEDHDVRPVRVRGEPAQHRHLGEHQVTGCVRQPERHVVHACVLTVHGPESVTHVEVGEGSELVGERAAHRVIFAGLRGLEAKVLDHEDVAVS